MYYIIYEVTNLINNKKYRGKHKTNNIEDDYLGSGKYIKRAIEKYGKHTFKKEIIFMALTEDDLNWVEKNIFVNQEWLDQGRNKTYNLKLGGVGGFKVGMVSVGGKQVTKDEFDNNNSLVGVAKGFVPVVDENGRILHIKKEDMIDNNFVACWNRNGTVPVIDGDGKKSRISKQEFDKGGFTHITKGTITVKDKNGNSFRVQANDPRFLSGELVGITKGISNQKFIYEFYDNDHQLIYICENTSLSNFIEEHGMPTVAFINSFRRNGEPIYQNMGSNKSRIEAAGWLKFKGWYCIRKSKNEHRRTKLQSDLLH